MIDLNSPNARRWELFGAAGLILALLIFALWYMATHKAPAPYVLLENVATTTAPVIVPPQSVEEHAQYYDVDAVYPGETSLKASAGAPADAEAISSMKSFIENMVADFKREGNFANLTPEDIQMLGFSDGRKESLGIEYKEYAGAATVSFVFSIYLDTLGAHPNAFYRTFTFNAESGAELAIGDLFIPRSDYLKRLSAIARFDLAKALGDMADIDYINQGTTPEVTTFQSFAIDGGNLVLIFPPYQVAAYAAGTQTVTIPLTQLKDILKPTYQPK